MALPINIEALITQNVIESERIEFKQGWNPQVVLHFIALRGNTGLDALRPGTENTVDGKGNASVSRDAERLAMHSHAERGNESLGFAPEDVLVAIDMGHILDDLEHPNIEKYPNQSILVMLLKIKNYVYIVPYIEDEHTIFLKTIIPSRKLNKLYNKAVDNG